MSMPTHPEVVTLDPASNDDALRLAAAIRSVCDIDGRWDAAEILQALIAAPLPEEPPLWSVVRVANSATIGVPAFARHDVPGDSRWYAMNVRQEKSFTWPEVCALGTPEVLEPETVKALREQVGALMYQHGTLVEDIWNESPAHQDATDEEAFRAIIHQRDQYGSDARKAEARAQDFEGRYETAHNSRMHAEACLRRAEAGRDEARATIERVRALDSGIYQGGGNAHAYCICPTTLRAILKPATEDEPAEPAPVEAAPFGWVNPENTRIRLNPACDMGIGFGGEESGEVAVWLTQDGTVETGGQS